MKQTTRPPLDIAMIAGRRPELIHRTLSSFSEMLFRHFRIEKVAVNLDPFMGRQEDEAVCCDIIKTYLPHAKIRIPQTPSFGAAVKYVWSKMSSNLCLHLEDDWICLQDITPDLITPYFDAPDTGMVYLAHKERRRDHTNPRMRIRKEKFWGITVQRRKVTDWGTSPRFIAGDKARLFSNLIDPSKDPEKQVYHSANKRLCEAQEATKTYGVWGKGDGPLLRDIGRDYRDRHKWVKVNLPNGNVYWKTVD